MLNRKILVAEESVHDLFFSGTYKDDSNVAHEYSVIDFDT